jgi:predicted RNase H-like nuclease
VDGASGELSEHLDGDCLAAIDAPIVVTNATGSRPAEQQLSKDFRRYEAATHPSNTSKPEFANGTRAARLARRVGWTGTVCIHRPRYVTSTAGQSQRNHG